MGVLCFKCPIKVIENITRECKTTKILSNEAEPSVTYILVIITQITDYIFFMKFSSSLLPDMLCLNCYHQRFRFLFFLNPGPPFHLCGSCFGCSKSFPIKNYDIRDESTVGIINSDLSEIQMVEKRLGLKWTGF